MITKPGDLREKNMGRVIQLLLANPDISRVEIARKTELTKTTISAIIAALLDLNIVEETPGLKTGLVGKTPIPMRVRGDAAVAIGVNLARGSTSGVVMTLTRADATAHLFEVVQRLLNKCFRNGIDVDAIGIGAPSPLDKEKGVIYAPYGLSDWKDFPVGEITREKFGLPVFLVNDADGERRDLQRKLRIFRSDQLRSYQELLQRPS